MGSGSWIRFDNKEVLQFVHRASHKLVALAVLGLAAAAIAGCSQAPPSPTSAPPPTSAAPPTSAPAAASPSLAPVASPAVSAVPKPAAPAPSLSPIAAASVSPAAAPTPLSAAQLTAMEPGLSSFMMESAKRMGRSWFAGQAGNWDEAAFEIREAREVLQHGSVRQNATRQQAIGSFNTNFMDPLVDAAQAGDRTQYETAYRAAIQGCNACHGSQTYSVINRPFSFIRVQVPTNSIWDVYAFAK